MDVLIVGSGGREHALAWKLKQSPRVGRLYIAPGNAGTGTLGENVPIDATDVMGLAKFASEKSIELTVVGPDDVFAAGIVDLFQKRGLRIWGPTKAAAQIESSKAFAKQLMQEARIPTATFKVFNTPAAALSYARVCTLPLVVKASGLALGKGVYICRTIAEVETALQEIMVEKVHKAAGDEVVVEAFLEGQEVSIHALADGISSVLFPPTQDHKRSLDGDAGKNTGGMGAIGPVPWLGVEGMSDIEQSIVRPALNAMRERDALFTGLLYPGIILTVDGPKVLEFNARFGDPECQVYMRLLESDLLDLLEACVDGTLGDAQKSIRWGRGFAVNIVVASGGYPDEYKTGFPISGIEEANKIPDVVVFHAGTKFEQNAVVTAGGRVLGVSATGASVKEALDRAYEAIGKIKFEGMHFRRDIGAKALEYYSSIRV